MRLVLPLIAMTAVAGAAAAQTVDVETAAGTASVPQSPATVAAFDLAAIDALDALGVEIAGVPDIIPPAYLAPVLEGSEVVGTLFEPDFEKLAAMGPDLIVAGGRSQAQVEPLSRIAATIDMTIREDIVAEGLQRIETYGTIFGKEAEAETLAGEIETAMSETSAVAEGRGDALIVLTNGGKVSAYGAGSRFGWIHSALGIEEAYPDLDAETHGEAVSFEFIAEVDPEWIFVVDRGAAIGQEGEAASATLDNPLVAGTQAGRNGQIVYLDSAPLYLAGGGPRSLMGTMEEIRTAMEDASGS